MNITPQQQTIIKSNGNARINAVAGSGKTSTLVEYALAHPGEKILYVAFNKNVKTEAIRKFQERGATNVSVETMHSLAFHAVVKRGKYTVQTKTLKASELVKILPIEVGRDRKEVFAIAKHILALSRAFCNSAHERVDQVDYKNAFKDPEAVNLLEQYYKDIMLYARKYLGRQLNKKIAISHDLYLKQYQLQKPTLGYGIILFDEAQDASPVMLDIILRQNAIKVIVGDAHQQIYGWRSAVNSLEKVDFPSFLLTKSFRFGPEIAAIANKVLHWKTKIGYTAPEAIEGVGQKNEIKTRAVIGRSNLALLIDAIDRLIKRKTIKNLYFEGRFETYTISEEGSSLYDVLNLYNGKRERIRDEIIASMQNLSELEEFAKASGDSSLLQLIEIIEEYGDQIPTYINRIKEAQVDETEKSNANIIYSTVHRCKGLEYDEVTLLDDFIDELQVSKQLEDDVNPETIAEEINILYVAITRALVKVNLPLRLKALQSQASTKKTNNKTALSPAQLMAKNLPKTKSAHVHPDRPWTDLRMII